MYISTTDIYRISPCIMRCFFLAIHVTKRHLVLYIDVEFNTFFQLSSGKFCGKVL